MRNALATNCRSQRVVRAMTRYDELMKGYQNQANELDVNEIIDYR